MIKILFVHEAFKPTSTENGALLFRKSVPMSSVAEIPTSGPLPPNRPMRGRAVNVTVLTLIVAIVILSPSTPCKAQGLYGAPPENLKLQLRALLRAYPDWISGYDDKFLFLKTGTKFAISDGRTNKTFDQLLEAPDIDDMFFVPYPTGKMPQQPAKNFDPGRVRYQPLFTAMYGDCRKNGVTRKLRKVAWLPKHGGGYVLITTVNGVDRALQAVSYELDELPASLIKYLNPTAGTYNCRNIAGSNATSMHAYAAAIDINAHFSNYWRWVSKNAQKIKWKNLIPVKIIRIFEKHGFIWGGYWYHYDTMHFEYRPELLKISPRSRE